MKASTRAFLEQAPFADSMELEVELDALLARARNAWPELSVTAEELARYAGARFGAGQSLDALEAGDLLLACAAARGDEAAARSVRELCLPRIAAALSSVGLADAVDETAQQVLSELLVPGEAGRRGIEGYRGSGPLAAFVKVIALRAARRARKRAGREQPMDPELLAHRATAALDPELEGLKRKYREEFKQAFQTALATLSDREQNLLRYELVGNLSVDEIAKLYDVHRATLARWRSAAREKLFVETERALRAALGIGATDFRSIVRWIDSELDVSLSRVLGASEAG